MFRFQREKCTTETLGTLVKKTRYGDAWYLTVEYIGKGSIYKRNERLSTAKNHGHKSSWSPRGIRKRFVLENTDIGTLVRVMYNPKRPSQSYLPDNIRM